MSRLSVVHSGKNDPRAFRSREFRLDARQQKQSVRGGDVVGVEQAVTDTDQLFRPALCLRTSTHVISGEIASVSGGYVAGLAGGGGGAAL